MFRHISLKEWELALTFGTLIPLYQPTNAVSRIILLNTFLANLVCSLFLKCPEDLDVYCIIEFTDLYSFNKLGYLFNKSSYI